MKTTLVWLTCAAILLLGGGGDPVAAWGGVFNRFSPELLGNLGYGAGGGGGGAGSGALGMGGGVAGSSGNALYYETDDEQDKELCYGKRCTANEHCCQGSVCVNVDGVIGNCLFAYGGKLGELCRRDADCESGLVCDVSAMAGASVCTAPMAIPKQYAEECSTSSDCDITRGLCCSLQRRHRMALRKVCLYFKDPLTCIGTVAMDQIKQEIEHTAGEKRITNAYKSHNLI